MKTIRLISSENRFYEMRQISDSIFISTWGNIGSQNVISVEHTIDRWDKILTDKLNLGFEVESRLTSLDDLPKEESIDYMLFEQEQLNPKDLIHLNIADHIAEIQERYLRNDNSSK